MNKIQLQLITSNNYFRYALQLSLASTIVVTIYQFFHIKNGYFAEYSVIACIFPTYGQSIQRALYRILGTFIGMFFGIVIGYYANFHVIILDIFIFFIIFCGFYLKIISYWLYAFFTPIWTVLFACLMSPGDWQIAIIRFKMTLFGAIVAILTTSLVLPNRSTIKIPEKIKISYQNMYLYYISLCKNEPYFSEILKLKNTAIESLKSLSSLLNEEKLEIFTAKNIKKDHLKFFVIFEKMCSEILTIDLSILYTTTTNKDLLHYVEKISVLMQKIGDILFNQDINSKYVNDIETSLQEIYSNVIKHRTDSAYDLSIQSVTFFEHMNLSNLLETLISILNNRRKLDSNNLLTIDSTKNENNSESIDY